MMRTPADEGEREATPSTCRKEYRTVTDVLGIARWEQAGRRGRSAVSPKGRLPREPGEDESVCTSGTTVARRRQIRPGTVPSLGRPGAGAEEPPCRPQQRCTSWSRLSWRPRRDCSPHVDRRSVKLANGPPMVGPATSEHAPPKDQQADSMIRQLWTVPWIVEGHHEPCRIVH